MLHYGPQIFKRLCFVHLQSTTGNCECKQQYSYVQLPGYRCDYRGQVEAPLKILLIIAVRSK